MKDVREGQGAVANIAAAKRLKAVLLELDEADQLVAWRKKARGLYSRQVMFTRDDRDLLRGLWDRPVTFPAVPIGNFSRRSTAALTTLAEHAEQFARRSGRTQESDTPAA